MRSCVCFIVTTANFWCQFDHALGTIKQVFVVIGSPSIRYQVKQNQTYIIISIKITSNDSISFESENVKQAWWLVSALKVFNRKRLNIIYRCGIWYHEKWKREKSKTWFNKTQTILHRLKLRRSNKYIYWFVKMFCRKT